MDNYVKVMDHIQNDIVGLEPKNWDLANQIKNVQKYCSALIRYADEDTARGLQSSQAIKTLIDNVQRRTKMALVEKDKTVSIKSPKSSNIPSCTS